MSGYWLTRGRCFWMSLFPCDQIWRCRDGPPIRIFPQIWKFCGGGALCGLVLLQSWDVQGRRGPPAPLLQLPVLEEEVEGGQGDTGLRRGLTERVRHAAVQVSGQDAVLPTQGRKSHIRTPGRADDICRTRIHFSGLKEKKKTKKKNRKGEVVWFKVCERFIKHPYTKSCGWEFVYKLYTWGSRGLVTSARSVAWADSTQRRQDVLNWNYIFIMPFHY